MIVKLVKFIIKTRFTLGAILLLLSMDILGLLDSFYLSSLFNPTFVTRTVIFFSLIISLYLISLFLNISRVSINKSDAQYLFTLPLDLREIRFAIVISNYISVLLFSPTISIAFVFVDGVSGIIPGILYTLLAQAFTVLPRKVKLIVGVLFPAWFIAFPYYSPLGIIYYPLDYNSYYLLALLDLVLLLIDYKYLEETEMESFRSEDENERENLIFNTPNVESAVVKVAITYLPSLNNKPGGELFGRISRVDIIKYVPIAGLASLFYMFSNSLDKTELIKIISPLILTVLEASLLLQEINTSFSFEPVWLSFGTVEESSEYARYYLAGRGLLIFLGTLPISIAFIVFPHGLINGLMSLSLPFIYFVVTSLRLRLYPIQTIGDKQVNYRIDILRVVSWMFITFLVFSLVLTFPLYSLFFYSMSLVLLSLIMLLSTIVVGVLLLFWNQYWEKTLEKMVDLGLT